MDLQRNAAFTFNLFLCMSVFVFAGLGTNTSALCMPLFFSLYSLHGTLFSLQLVYLVGMCE